MNEEARGGAVVEALCYKPEGHGINSRWCHRIFFYGLNLSGCTVALGSTQPLTEMSTGNISWGQRPLYSPIMSLFFQIIIISE
jgi:hypothetical protein